MRRFCKILGGTALALGLSAASLARAELVSWSYAWTPNPGAVLSDGAGRSEIILTNEPGASAAGSSDIVATNLYTVSNAAPDNPDKFTNKAYTLTLTLTDTLSHQSSDLVFSGLFNGSVSALSSNVTNQFTGLTTRSVVLGHNDYTVTLNAYTPPSVPGAENAGAIGAHADARVQVEPHQSPEPATLILSGLGVSMLCLNTWRKRRTCPR